MIDNRQNAFEGAAPKKEDRMKTSPQLDAQAAPQQGATLNDIIARSNSLRGALFALRTDYQPFRGTHLGFEHVVGGNRHVRGDLINPTTLPASFGALYAEGGGAAFDPVVQMATSGRDHTVIELMELLSTGPGQFRRHRFLNAMVEIGCVRLTSVCLPRGEAVGRIVLTVMEGQGAAPRSAEDIRAVLRQMIACFRVHGHIARYFDLKPQELSTLQAVAFGQSAQDIATRDEVSVRTIEFRLQRARKKLRAMTTAEAVFKASAYGLIGAADPVA